MPHIEIKYSENLDLDTKNIFDTLEEVINKNDSSSGVCKSRAYPCAKYKYSHILVTISLLTKPHRNDIFTQKLSKEIEESIKKYFTQSLYFSLDIEYSQSYYTTNTHLVEGDDLLTLEDNTNSQNCT